jgi:outer membrane protein assembly factor BamB
MTGNGERRRSALKIRALAAMAALILGACGDGANPSSGGPETTAAPAQGGGRVVAGAQAFPFVPNCNRAVSDGKEFLAVGCPGSVTSLDPANGTARWEVKDPTWTAVDRLELAGEVVVASVRVIVPASGLTAKEEGRRVVALADGKKLWETKLHPSSPSLSFAGTAEIVGVSPTRNPADPASSVSWTRRSVRPRARSP